MIRRPKGSALLIGGLLILIVGNEAQRINAQWAGHRERQAQLFAAQANGMKLDKVIQQDDLQLQLLMQHSTDLERLRFGEGERLILARPPATRP